MKVLLILVFLANVYIYAECDYISKYRIKSGNGTIAPFNTIVGYASINVASYSNGNDSHTPEESSYLYQVYTGIKWQCVEFARRWLFIRKGCVFHQIVGAADIWSEVNNVQRVVDKECFNLKKYPNGSPSPPKNETLLIYAPSRQNSFYGHVAIIVDVLPNSIRVAEENYNSYYWSGNYSREIPYIFKNGGFYIEDQMPIFGWMQLDDNNQTKALDQQTIDQIIKLNGTSPDFICHNSTL